MTLPPTTTSGAVMAKRGTISETDPAKETIRLYNEANEITSDLINEVLKVSSIPGYLTTAQAAERLEVTSGRIRQLICAGKLQATKIGDTWLISEESLEKFVPNWRRPGWEKGRPRKTEG